MSMYTLLTLLIIIAVLASWADKYIMSSRMEPFREGLDNLWEKFKTPGAAELTQSLSSLFCDFFDLIYGSKMFSRRRLIASSISSLLAFFVLLTLGYLLFIDQLDTSIGLGHIVLSLIVVALVNLVPDYLSLAETRLVLRWSKNKGLLGVLFFIFLDLVATALIFVIVGSIVGVVFTLLTLWLADGSMVVSDFLDLLFSSMGDLEDTDLSLIGLVSVFTTFFTSFFWICFVLCFLLTKLAFRLFPLTKYFYDQLSETDRPITAIAGLINIFITFTWLSITAYISLT